MVCSCHVDDEVDEAGRQIIHVVRCHSHEAGPVLLRALRQALNEHSIGHLRYGDQCFALCAAALADAGTSEADILRLCGPVSSSEMAAAMKEMA